MTIEVTAACEYDAWGYGITKTRRFLRAINIFKKQTSP